MSTNLSSKPRLKKLCFAKKYLHRPLLPLCYAAPLLLAGCGDTLTYSQDAQREGMKEFKAGEYTDAAGSFRNAARQDPTSYISYYYLGASYAQLGQYQQAIQAFKTSRDTSNMTYVGQHDYAFRAMLLDDMAKAIAKSSDRTVELEAIQKQASTGKSPEDYLLAAKICRYSGDADLAIDQYNRAMLLAPRSFAIAKEFGLYLDSLGLPQRAQAPLARAYQLDSSDKEVVDAMRHDGLVPGPAVKEKEQLVKPPLPEGPLPEIHMGMGDSKSGSTPPPPAPGD